MCKHILNAQVSIRTPCCRKWYDCPECHEEKEDHEIRKTFDMVFACKKCKKVFRKNTKDFEDQDQFCPHCDNQFIVEAEEAKPTVQFADDDFRMDKGVVLDHRMRQREVDQDINDLDWSM